MKKFTKSMQTVLDIIDGKKDWRVANIQTGPKHLRGIRRKKRIQMAFDQLKALGLVQINPHTNIWERTPA